VASRRCVFGCRQGEWVKSELWGRRAAGDPGLGDGPARDLMGVTRQVVD
jgi:hypothetical protein